MLPLAKIESLNRCVPAIGLGCGRLVGGMNIKRSARMVETALDLGIRYFDVAPSYGMGTAESVLGLVVGDARDVVVATKYGVPRGRYSARAAFVRRFLKPAIDRFLPLKNAVRRSGAGRVSGPPTRPRYDFSEAAVRSSLNQSLELLRRSSVDVLLAHEPHRDDLTRGLSDLFEAMRSESRIGCFGVGINDVSAPWVPWGQVWQSGWPGEKALAYPPGTTFAFHGVLRTVNPGATGRSVDSAPRRLATAVTARPGSIFLVSASTPARLRELLAEFR
jgi:hypothetical protein